MAPKSTVTVVAASLTAVLAFVTACAGGERRGRRDVDSDESWRHLLWRHQLKWSDHERQHPTPGRSPRELKGTICSADEDPFHRLLRSRLLEPRPA
jgi:hypothetical protein